MTGYGVKACPCLTAPWRSLSPRPWTLTQGRFEALFGEALADPLHRCNAHMGRRSNDCIYAPCVRLEQDVGMGQLTGGDLTFLGQGSEV
jgi:hypothetical protein